MKRIGSWLVVIAGAVACSLWSSILLKILIWISSELHRIGSLLLSIVIWLVIGSVVLSCLYYVAVMISLFTVNASEKLCPSRKQWRYRIMAWFLLVFCIFNVVFSLIYDPNFWWIVPQSQIAIFAFILLSSAKSNDIEPLPASERVVIPLVVASCLAIGVYAAIIIMVFTGFISYGPAPSSDVAKNYQSSTASEASEETEWVWVSSNGSRYHRDPSCSNMHEPKKVFKTTAESSGRTPCKLCY